jgi:hypothetical protein
MEYKIDRVIYGDGRVVYEVYYTAENFWFGTNKKTMEKVIKTTWISLSLAQANKDYLQKEYQANKVISRKEVL